MTRRSSWLLKGLAVLAMAGIFFGVVGPIVGSLPFVFVHPGVVYLGLLFAFLPAALAGVLDGAGLLIYASCTRNVGWRTLHALAGGIAGWIALPVWSLLNGRFRDVPPDLMEGAIAQFVRSMFQLEVLLPFVAGAVCAAIFNRWAMRWLQSNPAAQSDAFRVALDAPSHGAPGRER